MNRAQGLLTAEIADLKTKSAAAAAALDFVNQRYGWAEELLNETIDHEQEILGRVHAARQAMQLPPFDGANDALHERLISECARHREDVKGPADREVQRLGRLRSWGNRVLKQLDEQIAVKTADLARLQAQDAAPPSKPLRDRYQPEPSIRERIAAAGERLGVS